MRLKKISALLLCFALLAGVMTACNGNGDNDPPPRDTGTGTGSNNAGTNLSTTVELPAGFEGIDFSNGNIDFLMMHFKPFDSSPDARIELSEFAGAPAAKVTPAGTARPYIAIDACSLLGDRIGDVAALEVVMAVENPDGSFYAVSGEIIAHSGANRRATTDSWSIFMANRNPATIKMELGSERMVSGAYNMFIIRRIVDNALIYVDNEYHSGTASNIFITRIGFLDAAGNYLPVNADAGFNAPDGFNESAIRHIELGVEMGDLVDFDEDDEDFDPSVLPLIMNCINSDSQVGWLTNRTDGLASPYLIEDMAAAQQLVLEFATPPKGGMQIIWLGSGNGWSWNQQSVIPDGGLSGTSLTINLLDVFDDYHMQAGCTEENPQMKLLLGYFNYSVPCETPDCEGRCDAGCDRNSMMVTTQTVADLQLTRAYLVIAD
jgi:hypothetical protein